MNYRHLYHAGNFADAVKHVTVIILLEKLSEKEAPFCFLDTHAGIGLYALQSEQAKKSQEYNNGISKIMCAEKNAMPLVVKKYVSIVEKYNADHSVAYYPGSPLIAEECLRAQDQMILCELHPDDYFFLKDNVGKSKQIAIHHMDGYLSMKAFLPPKQKRGLVLIDPPFEASNEFAKIQEAVRISLQHWRAGHYLIWYPMKDEDKVKSFYRAMRALSAPLCMVEFKINAINDEDKLNAFGLMLVNPPWLVKETLENTLPYLAEKLGGTFKIR